jgi:hypothetical protein
VQYPFSNGSEKKIDETNLRRRRVGGIHSFPAVIPSL